jgi:hypothetical protein
MKQIEKVIAEPPALEDPGIAEVLASEVVSVGNINGMVVLTFAAVRVGDLGKNEIKRVVTSRLVMSPGTAKELVDKVGGLLKPKVTAAATTAIQ